MKTICSCLLMIVGLSFLCCALSAQQATPAIIAGEWSGSLSVAGSSLPLVLHVTQQPTGGPSATLDSPAQGAFGLAANNVDLKGSSFRFEVPSVHGEYTGTVSSDGKTISGTWSQGKPLPLVFKQTATAAELLQVKPSPIDGDWAGTLRPDGASLRVVFHFHAAPGEKIEGSLDSLDQGSLGIPCTNVKLNGQKLSLDVPLVHGNYRGALSSDGNKLSGMWEQGRPLPLDLVRDTKHSQLIAPRPASSPVPLKNLRAVLDNEFAPVVASWPQTGIVVGVFDHGERGVFAYGTAKTDSVFEIGSITKTFTALALAQMVQQHTVTLDESLRELLPPGTVKPSSGPEITLLDLATQHSGLPRLPDNLKPKSAADPYADYTMQDLYSWLENNGVGRAEKPEFQYSNLGFGLLGQSLANKAGEPYAQLIAYQVTGPLGMKDTVISLSSEQQARFIPGYTASHDKAMPWNFAAMAGAGSLRSTADDMLTYAEAYLHPDGLSGPAVANRSTLPASLRLTQKAQADGPPGMKIGLAWLISPDQDVFWHNGGTGGYSSLIEFEPSRDRAIVVLYNCMDLTAGKLQFVDLVVANLRALLDGKPVPPLPT